MTTQTYNISNRKIFFSDLDGTLLNSAKTIGEETRRCLDQIVKQNHYLVLSSGRPLQSIKQVKEQLQLPDHQVFLIGFNGGVIYDCEQKKTIYEHRIEKSLVEPVFQLAYNHQLHVQTYNETQIICKKNSPELDNYASIVKLPVIYADNILAHLEKGPFKILAMSHYGAEKLDPLRKEIEQNYSGILDTLYSSDHLLEIFPANSGKGTALQRLADDLDIPLVNTIAAGDQENDISMLLAAGTSLAMKNGTDGVKKVATYITENDNNQDGLVPYLREFFKL